MNDGRTERLAGADAISAKAVVYGMQRGVAISACVWDIGEDVGHEYAHRLDVSTASETVRLYFSDRELTVSDNACQNDRTEDRLRRAIAQLVPRVPVPTYTYR